MHRTDRKKHDIKKIHPFSYGGEDRIFSRGNELVTVGLGNPEPWIIQPSICYDLRFPEMFRVGSQHGAHLIVVQANWPHARQHHWETLLRARAIENQAFVVGVNCTGTQAPLKFIGGSYIFSPQGDIVAKGGEEETVIRGHIELSDCLQWRKQFPALRDRMPWNFFRP